MEKKKAWIWFKGGEDGGSWVSGFFASKDKEGKVIIENPDFVTCTVPEWRVIYEEPKNKYQSPDIPNDAIWKF
tara:strand:+ start:84 stop:302 length:219 start_codon:yes stop_codon:yes gene_type:complete